MKQLSNVQLADYTSLRVGGPAELLLLPQNYDENLSALRQANSPIWRLGFGCNVLVSDLGLNGTTIVWRQGEITVNGNEVIADGGVWWDDVVTTAMRYGLWGLELLSEIPSSVGGAVYGNIAAYGQQVSDTLAWVEVFDNTSQEVTRLPASQFAFNYRSSSFQQQPNLTILRVAFNLKTEPTHELRYDSAVSIAQELGADISSLEGRRQTVVETRRRAGSIYHPDDSDAERSAGSFFKNPMVSTEQAKELARFDESGKTLERIENQNQIHGGDSHRASASHVLLAAGFQRGQKWGPVSLHQNHVLKIITHEGATATQVYAVVNEIINTVKEKLNIDLEPEVKFLGEF